MPFKILIDFFLHWALLTLCTTGGEYRLTDIQELFYTFVKMYFCAHPCFVIVFSHFVVLNSVCMFPVVRKPDFHLCENKVADQLHSNYTADQRLCFR